MCGVCRTCISYIQKFSFNRPGILFLPDLLDFGVFSFIFFLFGFDFVSLKGDKLRDGEGSNSGTEA